MNKDGVIKWSPVVNDRFNHYSGQLLQELDGVVDEDDILTIRCAIELIMLMSLGATTDDILMMENKCGIRIATELGRQIESIDIIYDAVVLLNSIVDGLIHEVTVKRIEYYDAYEAQLYLAILRVLILTANCVGISAYNDETIIFDQISKYYIGDTDIVLNDVIERLLSSGITNEISSLKSRLHISERAFTANVSVAVIKVQQKRIEMLENRI